MDHAGHAASIEHPLMTADQAYFYRRAEEEIARAQEATAEKLVSFHYHLAGLYLDRVYRAASDGGISAEA